MPGSRSFLGSAIPLGNPLFPQAPYYIRSVGALQLIWENSAPSSGGSVQIDILNVGNVANSLVSVMSGSNVFDLTTGIWTPSTINGTQFMGQRIQFSSTGTLPTGITTAFYYTYPIGNSATPTSYQIITGTNNINNAFQKFRGNPIPIGGAPGLVVPTDNGTPGATLTAGAQTLTGITLTLQHSNSFVYGSNSNLGTGPSTNVQNLNDLTATGGNFFRIPNNQTYEGSSTLGISAVGSYIISYKPGCAKYMCIASTVGNGAGIQMRLKVLA